MGPVMSSLPSDRHAAGIAEEYEAALDADEAIE
jgi:hypothetical protein